MNRFLGPVIFCIVGFVSAMEHGVHFWPDSAKSAQIFYDLTNIRHLNESTVSFKNQSSIVLQNLHERLKYYCATLSERVHEQAIDSYDRMISGLDVVRLQLLDNLVCAYIKSRE